MSADLLRWLKQAFWGGFAAGVGATLWVLFWVWVIIR